MKPEHNILFQGVATTESIDVIGMPCNLRARLSSCHFISVVKNRCHIPKSFCMLEKPVVFQCKYQLESLQSLRANPGPLNISFKSPALGTNSSYKSLAWWTRIWKKFNILSQKLLSNVIILEHIKLFSTIFSLFMA